MEFVAIAAKMSILPPLKETLMCSVPFLGLEHKLEAGLGLASDIPSATGIKHLCKFSEY